MAARLASLSPPGKPGWAIEIENAGQGNDTVYTAITFYQLGAQDIENVVVTGSGGSYVTGNALANLMVGAGGADTLDGGAGADKMTGGLGEFRWAQNDTEYGNTK